jgi:hypothetical protein
LPMFAVGKKNEEGQVVLNTHNVRIVADCARNVNFATKHKGQQSDSIAQTIQHVANFTGNGYMAVMDLQQMFYSFALDRSLWGYFVVEHPHMGLFNYVRLPQGWLASPAKTKEFMVQILYKFKSNLRRYMDDIVVYASTREKFMEVLKGVFLTLKFHNFRLKGSKVQILGKKFKLLGKTISNGKIEAGQHVINNVNNIGISELNTKRKLKRFLGMVAYISSHLPYATDLLKTLREASTGALEDKIEWTKGLETDFLTVKNKVNDLMDLYPVIPGHEVHLVVDSSYYATGAFMFQIINEKRRLLKIFSRRRSDADLKFGGGSCIVEFTGIIAAVTYCRVEIELSESKCNVWTDSKSTADLYRKLSNLQTPSENRKINDGFAKLMGIDYGIEYIKATTAPIIFADYFSRIENGSEKCTGCAICDLVDTKPEIFAKRVEKISNEIKICKLTSLCCHSKIIFRLPVKY